MIPLAAAAAASPPVLPINTALPTISGNTGPGGIVVNNDNLLCSTGTWQGTQPISFTYSWRDDANNQVSTANPWNVGNLTPLHSAYFYCIVTATNSVGSATAQTAHVNT